MAGGIRNFQENEGRLFIISIKVVHFILSVVCLLLKAVGWPLLLTGFQVRVFELGFVIL
jgi:hypothetical protein